ncbi:unnamed protein product [Hermetia illucens]|uniref:Amino acid permease N-terminal domain-containing protein n=1 Tax=Hermetia illucens TaxID=343691 RepID=A0A7R8UJQ7_HERIL|nr:unnamed protein product [Hermetia illucens]
MSDFPTMELNSVDRPNRFQVNPVVRKSVDTGDQQRYNNNVNCRDAESEDDTFNEDAANIIRRTSRIQSIKSSFRDKDKPSRFKDLQTTRFQVDESQMDESDSNESDEDRENLLENEYDTKYGKSFRHFTREALPRLDNYRNIMSIQAAYRPTLDELHNATLTHKVSALFIGMQ